jgi:alpha,alpha-trehalase
MVGAQAFGAVRRGLVTVLLAGMMLANCATQREATAPSPRPPSSLFEELYARVQAEGVFADSKTFADSVPREAPASILALYRAAPPADRSALAAFVAAHFDPPDNAGGTEAQPPPDRASLGAHIAALWPALTRPPARPAAHSSLLALAHPYVVPGGRFREMYYWDSYFTMLGLARDGHVQVVRDMTDNFADLIARYGHAPNGTRSYYLSRSQPPFFYLMVGLTDQDRAAAFATYLPALKREHAFWMHGEAGLERGHATEHVVKLADGSVLNRYWDALDVPRDESFREDLALAAVSQRPAAELYRDIRSAAESGWDFSSRWLADGHTLARIETTSIIPIDLNSLLYGLEQAIVQGCRRARDEICVREFSRRADARRTAVNAHLWNSETRTFVDYHWKRGARLDRLSGAMLYPLFVGLASSEQAAGVAAATRAFLLKPGGLVATPRRTGHQWDAPNGWAPLHWIAVSGFHSYGEDTLARDITARWLATVERVYSETGKLLEKYDVETVRPGGGGEYPLQDGFGWTNGVTRALMETTATGAAP